MNSKLTRSQQRTICSQLGTVELKLLFKASVNGFTCPAFHQRCDYHSPTVSVGYNASGYVFGGYTRQPFCQTGQYVNDNQAFLFTFSRDQLIKYPVTNAAYAVLMGANSGPYFGNALSFLYESTTVVGSNPGQYYNFNPAQMHGNDLNLTECEVYQVEVMTLLEKPWREIIWEPQKKAELMGIIRTYKPTVSSVSKARVLMIGPVGAGKSSFFNSINSVFRGHVTSQAMSGSSSTGFTTQFRAYSLKDGREGKLLPIILCDTMGLAEGRGAGLYTDDISSILRGHLPDRYMFNPAAPLQAEACDYQKSPDVNDKIHCVVYVIDACKMPTNLHGKLVDIRNMVNLLGVPQMVVLTKVDEACPRVKEDLRNVYRSIEVKKMMQKASDCVGVQMSCVVPVRNYTEELELNTSSDILLLSALYQVLRLADGFFDDISNILSDVQI